MRITNILLLAAGSFSAVAAHAQPSDAQIIKELKQPGVISVIPAAERAQLVWSEKDHLHLWARQVGVIWKSDIPEAPKARKIVIGQIFFMSTGNKGFHHWEGWQSRYEDVDAPVTSADSITAMINSDLPGFCRESGMLKMIGRPHYIRLVPGGKAEWDWPGTVRYPAEASYDMKTSDSTVVTVTQKGFVERHRDGRGKPWRGISFRGREKEQGKERVCSKGERVRLMTYGEMIDEEKIMKKLGPLPEIQVPEFATGEELTDYTAAVLRSDDEGRIRAFLMKAMSRRFCAMDSLPLLTPEGRGLVEEAIAAVCKREFRWSQQYCEKPLAEYHSGGVKLWNKLKNRNTTILFAIAGGTRTNGTVEGGHYMIAGLSVGMVADQHEGWAMKNGRHDGECGKSNKSSEGTSTTGATSSEQKQEGDLKNKAAGALKGLKVKIGK